ncbi:MAG: AgmX/PglI C-terminal domain-containing protein [Myxococcota bacterium]
MDPKTKELVTALYRNPEDHAAMQRVRDHLVGMEQWGVLAKTLEWRAGKVGDPELSASILIEAAEIRFSSDPARSLELLNQAMEHASGAASLGPAIDRIFQHEPMQRLELHRHRLELCRRQQIPAPQRAVAELDFGRALHDLGYSDEAIKVLSPVATKLPEAAEYLADLLLRHASQVPEQESQDRQQASQLLRHLAAHDPERRQVLLRKAFHACPSDESLTADLERELTGDALVELYSAYLRAAEAPEEHAILRLADLLVKMGHTHDAIARLEPYALTHPRAGKKLATLQVKVRDASRMALLSGLEEEFDSTEISLDAPRLESKSLESAAVQPPIEWDGGLADVLESEVEPATDPVSRPDSLRLSGISSSVLQSTPEVESVDPQPSRGQGHLQEALQAPYAGVSLRPPQLLIDEDDEEEDQSFIEVDPHDMLRVGEPIASRELSLEVVRFYRDRALDTRVAFGDDFASDGFPGLFRAQERSVEVQLLEADHAVREQEDGTIERLGGGEKLTLRVGEKLRVKQGELSWSVRPGFATEVPSLSTQPPSTIFALVALLALMVHVLLGVGFDSLADSGYVRLEVDDRPQEEIFAEAKIQTPAKRPDAPPPRPRARPKPRPRRAKAPPPPQQTRTALPRSLQERVRQVQQRQSENATENLLSRLTTPNAGSGQSLADVTTNIQAVQGGALAGGVTVTGVQAALEGVSGVNVASQSGGSRIGSFGGSSAVGQTGQLEGRARSGRVRGRVRAVSALGTQRGGSLDRGSVQSVINRAIGAIQACYERALMSSPGLSGRVTFAWTIQPNGRVSGVRQASSTLSSPQATSCMAGVLRRLRFPAPEGGSVQISYPFMFQQAP